MGVFIKNSIRTWLLVCTVLFLSGYVNKGYAQTFNFSSTERSTKHTGNDIYAHGFPDTITTWCNDWDFVTSTPTWGNSLKMKSNNSFVKFYVDNLNRLTKYQTGIDYKYYLSFSIKGYTNPQDSLYTYTSNSDTMMISFNNYDDNTPYQDLSMKKYSKFYKLEIVLWEILRDSAGVLVPVMLADSSLRNFIVEGSIVTQPYTKNEYGNGSGTTTLVINDHPHPASNSLELDWAFTTSTPLLPINPTNYELEWTYVDDYEVSVASGTESPIPASSLDYNFSFNSTKVWLNKNGYTIPIIYQRGYIIYRIRAVRPDSNLFKYPVYGNWSLPGGNSGNIGALASGYYHISSPYMGDMINWQYTASFAEGGKYKNVASFYDGLLKNRQSITRFNSNINKIIATNNIYDYEGQLCIKTLPAPINATSFIYQHDVDLNSTTGLPYIADDFDRPITAPYTTIAPMDPTALASLYYSGHNPDTTATSFQKFVPDAEGFPFVQTIYEPGYNGKVSAQGGAGPKLQIGTDNYIKNNYVSVMQPDINSFFGPAAGWSKFYSKTVSRDPNQQYSMTITDYEGKVMVSALIGDGPDSATHAINTVYTAAPDFVKTDLLGSYSAVQSIDTFSGTRIAGIDFFNEAHSLDSIQYSFSLAPYEACPGQFLNVKARYNCWISDEYGNLMFQEDTVIGANNVSATSTPLAFSSPDGSFSADIAPYHIQKSLMFSPWDVQETLDTFFNTATCFLTEPYFIRQSVSNAIFPCEPGVVVHDSDECTKMRWDMLQQLFPGEVYAGFSTWGDSAIIGSGNSIFDMVGCGTDTYQVTRHFIDSTHYYCYHPFATDGGDSMVIIYEHPTLGDYGYRCFCTNTGFPAVCTTSTSLTTTVTITATDLNTATKVIYVPFVSSGGGMEGKYTIRSKDIEALNGDIMVGSTVVGNITQYPGSPNTTVINLEVPVSGGNYNANINALSPNGDSFLFNFQGVMSPAYTDSVYYYTDSVTYDSVVIDSASATCHLRYRDTCTVPSLHDTIMVGGVLYTNLRTMRPDSFIMVYNAAISAHDYSIAEALLPLHPQYCQLNNCFVDTFKKMVLALPDWQTAESLHLMFLDSIVAHDPLTGIMTATGLYPSPVDSLTTFTGGTIRLDSLVFITAYCSCNDSLMFQHCYQSMFSYEISHHLLINGTVKEFYFNSIANLYFSNRQRFIDAVFMQGGDSCTHCADARMRFDPPAMVLPAFVPPVTSTYVTQPDSVNVGWMAGIMTDTLQQAWDSTLYNYHIADSALTYGLVDTIIAHLANCIAGNATLETGIRNSFYSLYSAGLAPGGNFSYAQVLQVLRSNGITTNDMCNPYIFDFAPFAMSTDNKCMAPDFFLGISTFINDPAVNGVLTSLGTVHSNFSLDTVTNTAERDMARRVGNYQDVDIIAAYSATEHLYTITLTPSVGGGSAVNIYLHSPGCGDVYNTLTGSYTTITDCINSSPTIGTSIGLVNQYSFLATVVPASGPPCSMTGWMDRVPTMKVIEDPIGRCLPCTEMRTLYTAFLDTLHTYGIQGTDHPYYATMLGNFMNSRLLEQYTSTDYETFIQSCALADSMLLPLYTAYATYKFTNIADVTAFASVLQGIDPDYTFETSYFESTVSYDTFTVCIDLNTVPVWSRWRYKEALDGYTGAYESRIVNQPLSSIRRSGEIGFLYFDPVYFPFSPRDSAIIDTTNVRFVGPYQKRVFIAGTPEVRDFYDVVALPGTKPYEVSQDVYKITAYLHNHSVPSAVFTPEYMSTVDNAYFKPEKQAYLNYTYNQQQLPEYEVMERIQAQYLQANIPSYASVTPAYTRDASPGLFKNLYVWNASMNSRFYDTLQKIIDLADRNTPGGGHIFNVSKTVSVPLTAPLELTDYVCSDGSYWYRYFTTGDTLFNVYIGFPDYIPKSMRSSYHVTGAVIPMPCDSNNRCFAVNVVRTGSSTVLQLYGRSSFVIGSSVAMENVLLRRSPRATENGNDTFNNCERQTLASAIDGGIDNYKAYINGKKDEISGAFRRNLVTAANEQLLLGYNGNSHFFTLYGYDRAGNLTSTSPPGGNRPIPLDSSAIPLVDVARAANTAGPVPTFTKANTYEYNTRNQPTSQVTINGGKTRFFYDVAGRSVFSQNAKQGQTGSYTYNLYDAQNRITETGEVTLGCPYFDEYISASPVGPTCSYSYTVTGGYLISADPDLVINLENHPFEDVAWNVDTASRRDVVVTIYDTVAANLGAIKDMSAQENLRKRVSCVKYFPKLDVADVALANYSTATHYSYDLEGNVQTLTQDIPLLAIIKQQYHRIDYDYDVISGKVNMLSYNRGAPDQFYQHYSYDDDNRIIEVHTSNDGYNVQTDARYSYYEHGPLARVEIGDMRVQGMDYAYTIQGWLKSVNGDTLNTTLDMGVDGISPSVTGKDAVAYNISYFTDDYKSISGRDVQHVLPNNKELFNGNINGQTVAINNFQRLTKQYSYDQQNRILSAKYAVTDPVTATLTGLTDYYNAYSYDPDGNIQTLERWGNDQGSGAKIMDSLKYFYSAYTDKLLDVSDTAANNYTNDIKQYTATGMGRYGYDAIGNTTSDLVSGQDSVIWNMYNKVVRTVNNTDTSTLDFLYDGAGNRIAKSYTKTLATGAKEQKSDIYIRDAQGNILATYAATVNYGPAGALRQLSYWVSGHDIYGSSRLGEHSYYPMQVGMAADLVAGVFDTDRLYTHLPWISLETQDHVKPDSTAPHGNAFIGDYYASHITGLKQYELTDHLGNVLATVSDKRAGNLFIDASGSGLTPGNLAVIDAWKPEVTGAYDYYPFGMYMPDRLMTDTTGHCLTTTFTGMTPSVYYNSIPFTTLNSWGAITTTSLAFVAPSGGGLALGTAGLNKGLSTVVTGVAPTATHIDIGVINSAGNYNFVVRDATNTVIGVTSVGVTAVSSVYVVNLTSPPTGSVKVSVVSTGLIGAITLSDLYIPRDTLTAHTIVSNVCNKDGYKYGYNGQLKVNEIAGVGNHNTAKYWEYDTRLGRRWNQDPKVRDEESPYSCFGGNPIETSDVNGDDRWDVIVGVTLGVLTDILPGSSGVRDVYTPTDAADYNAGLRGADNAAMVVGAGSVVGGTGAMGAGLATAGAGVTAASTGVGAPVGVPAAAGGVAIATTGAGMVVAGTYLMANTAGNVGQGYDRGKKVPNPDGKKGGAAHQEAVNTEEKKLQDQGYNTKREVKVNTPNGEKSKRYIDVQGTKKTGEVKSVQVGKQTKSGQPVSRERKAINDIHQATGNKPEFVPYNK